MTSPSQHSTSSWNASKDSTLPRTCSGEAHPTATLAAQHDSTPRLKGMVNWFVGKLDSRNPLVCHHFLIKVTILRKYTVLVILHFQTNPTGYGWYCIVYIYMHVCVCLCLCVCYIRYKCSIYISFHISIMSPFIPQIPIQTRRGASPHSWARKQMPKPPEAVKRRLTVSLMFLSMCSIIYFSTCHSILYIYTFILYCVDFLTSNSNYSIYLSIYLIYLSVCLSIYLLEKIDLIRITLNHIITCKSDVLRPQTCGRLKP